MTDIKDYLDEINCVGYCEATTALCELIDRLVKDVQSLELECISTRYLLSQHMPKEDGELLRMDILCNLARRHDGDPAYELYKNIMYDGGDPMSFCAYLNKIKKACNGDYPCWH